MNKLVTFISLFKGVSKKTGKPEWHASFKTGAVDVGATNLPKFDASLFRVAVSKDGKTRYLTSKFPLEVTFSDVRKGNVEGKYFTNISSIAAQPRMDDAALDALLAEPKPETESAAEDDADF